MDKITIFHNSPYTAKKETISSISGRAVSFDEFKQWVKSGKIISHFFRYSESRLNTHDLRLIAKPFALFLLIKLLSRKKALFQDKEGAAQIITWKMLASLFLKFGKDWIRKKPWMNSVRKEVESLSLFRNRKWDLSKPPVYLRTDLCFGLQSGGSVGHIAGVLNHLSCFTGKPIFITSDRIPTVRAEWETHVIAPGGIFWDFSELPALDYNRVFFSEAVKRIGQRTPSFIYQRYSLNHFSGIQLANHFGVPFILEFNGSEIWVSRNWGNKLKYEKLSTQIEMANLQAADLIVVVSDPLKKDLIEKGIPKEKIFVNPNGVDPVRYSPEIDGSQIRKALKIENRTVLGFIGTFGRWHGAEVLAESYGRLLHRHPELSKQTLLLMIGDGIMLPTVKKIIEKWGVSDQSICTGIVPQEMGPFYLAACDILVSPHIPNRDGTPFFGSPTKLFEYMAMGKGIVASNLDQIGKVLVHNSTAWMVNPGDSDHLMEGIKVLIENPILRQELGKKARQEVLANYTWKKHTEKIVDALSLMKP